MDIVKKIPAFAIGFWIWDEVFGQPNQPPLQFHADNVEEAVEHYRQFIETLRDRLASGERNGIRVLRDPNDIPNNQRFLLVELANENNLSITLALDVADAYVVGYRAQNRSYFFRNHHNFARSRVFTDTEQAEIPFESNYDKMLQDIARGAENRAKERERKNQANAGEGNRNQAGPSRGRSNNSQIINRDSISRGEIDLGINPLQAAISSLYHYERNTLAKSLIVIIQMISEAARFTYIERQVLHSIETYQTFRPNPCMIALENNWISLSRAVQRSNGQGQFRNRDQISLQGPNSIILVVGVTPLRQTFGLVLIKYVNPEHDEL